MFAKIVSLKSCVVAAIVVVAGSTQAFAHEYKIRITNMMSDELIAPIVVVPSRADRRIFDDGYVTPEAESQILTGDPKQLVEKIGKRAQVVHGTDGPPGVLLAPGKSVEITVDSGWRRRNNMRLIAMVAPTEYEDHFLSTVVNLRSSLPTTMDRYDIGHDEDRKSIEYVSSGAAKVEIIKVEE